MSGSGSQGGSGPDEVVGQIIDAGSDALAGRRPGGPGGPGGSSADEIAGSLAEQVFMMRDMEEAARPHLVASRPAPAPTGYPDAFLSGENAVADLMMAAIDPPMSTTQAHPTPSSPSGGTPPAVDVPAADPTLGPGSFGSLSRATIAESGPSGEADDVDWEREPSLPPGAGRRLNAFSRFVSTYVARPWSAVWAVLIVLAIVALASLSNHGQAPAAAQTPAAAPANPAAGVPGGGAAPAPAAVTAAPAGAPQVSVWQITDTSVLKTSGVKPDEVYDQAEITIPGFDPAHYAWIAVSSGKQLVDSTGKTDPPHGQEVVWAPNTDDYIVVSVTGPSGEGSASIDRNTDMAAAQGNQSVIFGTFPRVHVVTGIDWSTTPATTHSAVVSETGPDSLAPAFSGAGTYTFHFDFVNEFTSAAAHGPLWLLAGPAVDGGE